jgi:hypothetical protein
VLQSRRPLNHGGVQGSTGDKSGCRQRVEVHPLVPGWNNTTANSNYALAA